MQKAISFLQDQVRGLRTGGVTTQLIDTIKVTIFGQQTPIKHVASTSKVQNGISVTPYDPQMVGPICTTLKAAGFNSYPFSKTSVIVSVPPPSGEEKERVCKRI